MVLYSGHLLVGLCVLCVNVLLTSLSSHELICEICGGHMVEQKCKTRCPNCGFTRDCSDP